MKRWKARLLVASAATMIATNSAHAIRWYVDASQTGTSDGTSWATAYPALQSVLNHGSLTAGDEVWVANGTYKPTSYSASFILKAGVRVLGGFSGPGDDDESDRNPDPATNGCILSGDVDNDGVLNGDELVPPSTWIRHNCYHVVVAPTAGGTMEPDDTVLDGFSITMGYAHTNASVRRGGGILLDNGPLIRNCRVHNNFAEEGGGGIYIDENRSPVIRNSLIENNSVGAGANGGGIYILDDSSANAAPVKVLNTTIKNNTAAFGGGVFAFDTTELSIICCTFDDNTAVGTAGSPSVSGEGGGLYVLGPSEVNTEMSVVNCLIVNNTATGSGSRGGGVSFAKGVLGAGISNCTFDGNTADVGGAYYQANTAMSNDMKLENCNLWNNGDNEIHVEYGDLTVRYCNVNGGAAQITDGASGSVFYDDADFDTNNIDADPLYVSGSWRLSCGSPCINTGNTASVPADFEDVNENSNPSEKTPDRDLANRIIVIADMGCYEVADTITCPGDIDDSGVVNVTDLLLVIAWWGACDDPADCPGDAQGPCLNQGDGVVNVSDLLLVIGNWGSCAAPGGSVPESFYDCQDICDGLTGQALIDCMNACFEVLCKQGQTEFCDP